MKNIKILSILIILGSCKAEQLMKQAEKKDPRYVRERGSALNDTFSAQNWPAIAAQYDSGSLGQELQIKFRQHCGACGLPVRNPETRDYIPEDIVNFLQAPILKRKVESANYASNSLLYFIFSGEQRAITFNNIDFSDDYIIDKDQAQFQIDPSHFSDYFLLTKSCGAFLKSKLSGGVNPPMSSFKAVVENDLERKSTIVAIKGKFYSPLTTLFNNTDSRSLFALLKLWKLYQTNPTYINNAYYFREFEGVAIKQVASNNSSNSITTQVGVDFKGPMSASVAADFSAGLNNSSEFLSRDWQTINVTNYNDANPKNGYFRRAKSPTEIAKMAYESTMLVPTYASGDVPDFIRNNEHTHRVVVYGVPSDMTSGYWDIRGYEQIYKERPYFEARPYLNGQTMQKGCEFIVKGIPKPEIFSSNPVPVQLNYKIVSLEKVGDTVITFKVSGNINTNNGPKIEPANSDAKFTTLLPDGIDNTKVLIAWEVKLDIKEDLYNIVDYSKAFSVSPLIATYNNTSYSLRVVEVKPDAARSQLLLKVESNGSYAITDIVASSTEIVKVSTEITIPRKNPSGTFRKTLSFSVLLPTKTEKPLEPIANQH